LRFSTFIIYSLFACFKLWAEAPPVVLEKGKEQYEIGLNLDILEDKKGNLTISDVSELKWSKEFKRSTSLSPNLGRSKSTFWARFKVKNLDPTTKWILSNSFVGQDYFDFYQKKKDGWKHIESGDMVEFSKREFKMRAFHFTLSQEEETFYYIKLKGFSNMLPLTISADHKFIKENMEANLAFGIYFGLAIMMLIHNLSYYLRLWEPNYLRYVCHVFIYIIFSGITSGYGYLAPTENLRWFNNEGHILFASLSPLSLNIFAAGFLNLREKNPYLYKISLFWSFIFVILAISVFFIPLFYMRRIHNLAFLLFFISLIFILSVKMLERFIPAKYFSAAIVSKIIGALILIMTLNGIITSNVFTRNASIFGSIIEMALFSLGLSYIQKIKQEEVLNTLETKVDERTSELKKTNIDLKNSNTALEKIQNERSIFFASLSHELRTPLNAILGFSKILYSGIKNNQQKEYINSISTSGRSLLRLVNSVHDFTKIELNELKIEKKRFNLEKVLTSSSLFFKSEAENKGISFSLEMDENLPSSIDSDELAFKQVLDNLLSNAIKFTNQGHIKIKVTVNYKKDSEDKCELIIYVEDSGYGLPTEKVESLFKPFSQVHKRSSFKERGSGLGLYISSKIIEDLGGKLKAMSTPGKGSIFTINLSDVTYSNEKVHADKFSYKFFGGTILIADDFPINIKLYKAYLSQYNLGVDTAKDGSELLEKAKKLKPNLILTDYEMPGLKGDEVLKKLREENINTPVILISAIKLEDSAKKIFQGFLQKPVDEETFLKTIAMFLKHEEETQEEEVKNISHEFKIPDNLDKTDIEFLKVIQEKVKLWKESMEISEIENESYLLKEKIQNTKLTFLLPFLNQLNMAASAFKIKAIESLLGYAIENFAKTLK
tara:strand:- start:5312 stop:7981 length:2670 start_codon:yes stop_codon:yes gene_type:complete